MESQVRILVVDDEKGLQRGVKRLLEAEGFIVEAAENGLAGISLGTQKEFDLAIIDLKMPDVDGLQVLKEIRKVHPNTICFIATAYASYENAVDSIKYGAYSYIPKPFTSAELLEKVKEGLDRRNFLLESERWKKEREERLLEVAYEKSRLNVIINSTTEGLLVINKNGQVVLFNPSAVKLLRFESIRLEEYILKKLHPELSELVNSVLAQQPGDRKALSREIEITEELIVEATASPVLNPEIDGLAGVVTVIKNITETKKIETLKSQFVSMVSHELKAPLAAVYGFLQLITDPSVKVNEEQKENFINRSKLRLDGMLKLVNDLLDISRMETRGVRELKELDLSAVIKYVLDTFQNEFRLRELTVDFHTSGDIPFIKADEEEMKRLFTNLISNAVKYNRQKGEINIAVSQNQNFLIVKVADTGIGLREEEKKRLFQEFFRAKNEFTKKISGTGLGLSIVKRIVDSYSGKIEVESKYGEGTSFILHFPKENNALKQNRVQKEST